MKRLSFAGILFSVLLHTAAAHDVHSVAPGELTFKENKNQWDERIRFLGEVPGGTIFLEPQGFTFRLFNTDDLKDIHPRKPGAVTVHGHVYKVSFAGSNPSATVTAEGKSATYYNYFTGNNPSRWASGVHAYNVVNYKNIYPNTDLKVYGSDYSLKYDLILRPGADATNIRFHYSGADELFLRNGNLIVRTSVGDVVEVKPYTYQIINGKKKEVGCEYRLNGEMLSFYFPKGYNRNEAVVIDPKLIFSTYTGSTADNWGYTATYDDAGNLYMGGYVNTLMYGGNYPVTTGAFQQTFGGGTSTHGVLFPCDMGICKISSDGKNMIYATYLGGADNEVPHSLVVNGLGQLCVYGKTYSSDFPVTSGAYDNSYNGGSDITVTVFNAAGTALVGSTYVGGSGEDGVNYDPTEFTLGNLKYNYGDDARGEIICDKQNNLYISGCTSSSDFPVTAGCYQPNHGGVQDGCIFKMNPVCTALIYSTYIGGTNDDACYSIDLKPSDNSVYVCGGTMSTDFPVTAGSLNAAYLGGFSDGFLLHLNASGTSLLASTFLGTDKMDQTYNVKLDLNEDVYVVGLTEGSYPVTAGVYSNPNSGQYISKLNPALNSIVFSTVFGNGNGMPNISPTAFLVDTCQNLYVCGWGTSSSMFIHTTDMTGLPLTPDAYQKTTDGTDFYIIVLKQNAQSLLYGTYFGGNGAMEHVDGGTSRFDKKGIIYEAVCASCNGLAKSYPITDGGTPTTPGVWSTTNKSPNCNELGFKFELNLFDVKAKALADPAATGCAPLNVTFKNNSENATNYYWNLGTGIPKDTSTLFEPTYSYTVPGDYRIMLVASNPASCKGPDTAYTTVTVLNTIVKASITTAIDDRCDSVKVNFTGGSTGTATQFNWDFGDGTVSKENNPSHTFYDAGTYTITLIIKDSLACNPLDTVTKEIIVSPQVEAEVTDSLYEGCAPLRVTFNNHVVNADSVRWNFGDGSVSVEEVPTHLFKNPGTYYVNLLGINFNTCNQRDTAISVVKVYPPPVTAKFTASSVEALSGTPIHFTNQTTGADNFFWNFGDETTSKETNPVHSYEHSGTFTACLTVNSDLPCPDSACIVLKIEPPQAVDVPNAFSPNGDNRNDILYVRGQKVTKLLFKVFNRWGEKVFETTDMNIGWDGTYKGVPQEMDVYAWELFATLRDGTQVVRSGNVTLIR